MNYRIVSKVLGIVVLLLAAAMLVCEIYGFALEHSMGKGPHDFALLKSFVVAALVGGALRWFGHGSGNEVLRKEGIAIVGLGWVISTLVGALPFVFCHPGLSVAASIFESASGFTTTGSTAIPDLDQHSHSILLWRATTQWLGGMGILVLFVALLSTLGVGSKALFRYESSAQIGYGFHARIRETAIRLWQIYTGLTVICIAGLVILGMSLYDAILHGFAAISTGGFGSRNNSMIYYDSASMDIWLTIFMILGGTSFVLMARVLRRDWTRILADEEFRAYLLILFSATLIIAADLIFHDRTNVMYSLRVSSFQVASVMTTTGFANADFDQWPTLSKAVLVFLMFIGGCAGSTSGAIKVSRVLIFCKSLGQELVNAFRPNQVVRLRLNGEMLDDSTKAAAVFFIAMACATVGFGTLAMTLLEPQLDLVSAFTAVTATLFNIGPGLGAFGPAQNFASIGSAAHLLLAFLMLLGRLEFFALLVLFLPALWRRY